MLLCKSANERRANVTSTAYHPIEQSSYSQRHVVLSFKIKSTGVQHYISTGVTDSIYKYLTKGTNFI